MAPMQARAKNDMKPSDTPCTSVKRALWRARSSITALMSTSLKVVRIAAVCCACTRRSAMRWRRCVIGTRSSSSLSRPAGRGTRGPRRDASVAGVALAPPASLAAAS